MEITSTLTFNGSPDRVADMLVNPSFMEHVAKAIDATAVQPTAIEHGLSTVFSIHTPQAARRILGETMTVNETVTWHDDVTDPRLGQMSLNVVGMPAHAEGPLTLSTTPTGSTMVYQATFEVRIPLLGKKIEQLAESNITGIMTAFEKVGNAWLELTQI